jgi:hypothetical protein
MVRPENKKMKCGHNRNVQRSTNDIDVQGKIISFFRFHLDKVWTTIDQGTRFVVGVPFMTPAAVVATTTATLGQPQKN